MTDRVSSTTSAAGLTGDVSAQQLARDASGPMASSGSGRTTVSPSSRVTDGRHMLIAEDLLLLLTADDTGKPAADSTNTNTALGGALLAELALAQRVDIAGPDERVREGRLIVRDVHPTGDRVLDDALATVGHREGEKPQNVLAALGKQARVRLYERLTAAGLLRAEEGRILGIFPTHRWPAEHTGHETAVRTGLAAALRDGGTTDARTRALASLLLALKAVHEAVAPESVGLSKRELNENAERIAEGDWVGKAVRSAIDTETAIIAAGSSGHG
ncbi:GOLPH3/VPS74 family protein [Geodermatophilus sp. SYSU D00684]